MVRVCGREMALLLYKIFCAFINILHEFLWIEFSVGNVSPMLSPAFSEWILIQARWSTKRQLPKIRYKRNLEATNWLIKKFKNQTLFNCFLCTYVFSLHCCTSIPHFRVLSIFTKYSKSWKHFSAISNCLVSRYVTNTPATIPWIYKNAAIGMQFRLSLYGSEIWLTALEHELKRA